MRLTVSERSWHLRYVRWVERVSHSMDLLIFRESEYKPYTPTDLCGYFWVVTLSGPSIALWGLTFLPVALTIKWLCLLVFWGVAAAFHGIRALVGVLRPGRITGPDGPNIALEYIKAKKRKVCPLIEVVP